MYGTMKSEVHRKDTRMHLSLLILILSFLSTASSAPAETQVVLTGAHNLVARKGNEMGRTSNLAVTGAGQPVAVRCTGVDDTKALADAVSAAKNAMIVIESDQLCAVKEII